MIDCIAGYSVSIPVQFTNRGQPAVPAANSVFYTLYDHSGTPYPDATDIAVATSGTTTQVAIPIPSGKMTIDSGKRFESRTILVRSILANNPANQVLKFRVIPLLNHSVTPNDVRNYCGLNDRELLDHDVDLLSAYLAVEEEVTKASLDTALSSGTSVEAKANEAIKLKAVIDLIPSMKARMSQSENNGIVSFTRASNIDFNKLAEMAATRYGEIINTVAGRSETAPTLLIVTNPTDPITGA